MPKRTLKIPSKLFRAGGSELNEDGTIRLSISSETPYLRYDWFADEEFYEVLDHSPRGMDSSRLKAGAALLFNHDRDIQLGTISSPEIKDGRCYVNAKLSDAPDVASFRVRVKEGILKDTSVGYSITNEGKQIGEQDGIPVYKFSWEVFEASLVTIPADTTCGVGRQRGKEDAKEFREIIVDTNNEGTDNAPNLTSSMPPKNHPAARQNFRDPDTGANATTGSAPSETEVRAIEERALAREQKRQADIRELYKHFKENGIAGRKVDAIKLCDEMVADRTKTVADFQNSVVRATLPEIQSIRAEDSDRDIEEVSRSAGGNDRRLSIGNQFVRSKQYKEVATDRGSRRSVSMEYDFGILGIRGKVAMAQRAGFTSTDLSAVNVQIQQGVVALGVQRLTVMDMIAPGTTGAAAIIYPQESTYGTLDGVSLASTTGVMPKAGTVGERGLKPNWEPDLTTVTAAVKKVAVTTKVPDEFMADFPASQSYIDERLPYMVDTRTEQQILYGDGVGNNLKGIFTFAGVQTRAVVSSGTPGTDDWKVAQSLRQGLTDISVGSQFEPDGFAFHPYDWETAQLLKDSNGRFLAGGPYYIPYTNGVFMEINTFWGKPTVITTAVAYGRPLAAAWKLGAQYFMREGMRLEMTNANEDDFRRNLICIRAEHRLAVACYRPVAFLEFTGFPARSA